MELFNSIIKELLSKKVVEIKKDEVNELSKYTARILHWCLSEGFLNVCNSYVNLIIKYVESVTPLRVSKFFNYGASDKSFDSNILSTFEEIIKRYYSLILFSNTDNELRVPVKILKEFELGKAKLFNGAHILMDLHKATLYEALGFCEILDINIKSLINNLIKAKKGIHRE